MRTTIRLDDPLLRRAKARAAERGISLNDFIVESISAALQRRAANTKSMQLPVFKGSGLLPGVDLDDSSALLDLMERRDFYSYADVTPRRVAERQPQSRPRKRKRRK